MTDRLDVSIWRGAESGRFVDYEVPRAESQTVLDVVTFVQRELDSSLSYRFACRVGMCGSCAMMVNGAPRWTCRSHVDKVAPDGRLQLAPLRNLPVVKDLVADLDGFFEKWTEAGGRFLPSRTRADKPSPVRPDTPARQAADAGIECVNCAVCYAACDSVSWNPDYLGPAALNRAWTLVNDERDAGRRERLRRVAAAGGCHDCHSQQGCAAHCPNLLNPTAGIAGLKALTLKAALRGEL